MPTCCGRSAAPRPAPAAAPLGPRRERYARVASFPVGRRPVPTISATPARSASALMPSDSSALPPAVALVDQPEQQVLGADVVVTQDPGLMLRLHDNSPRPIRKPLKHAAPSGVREPPSPPQSAPAPRPCQSRSVAYAVDTARSVAYASDTTRRGRWRGRQGRERVDGVADRRRTPVRLPVDALEADQFDVGPDGGLLGEAAANPDRLNRSSRGGRPTRSPGSRARRCSSRLSCPRPSARRPHSSRRSPDAAGGDRLLDEHGL